MSLYRRRRWRWADRVLIVYALIMLLMAVSCLGFMFGYLLVQAGTVK